MQRAPSGWTIRDFRQEKRRDFQYLRDDVDNFLTNMQWTPIPAGIIDDLKNALEDIQYYIGSESWGH